MERRIALIGFGEAARAFAPGLSAHLCAYDRKTDAPDTRAAAASAMAQAGVRCAADARDAAADADAVLSLVTADQAVVAAGAGDRLPDGAWWFDMNSVAPDTKRAAAAAVAARGGRYLDVAVMAPVLPRRTAVPLLVSGPDAQDGATFLRQLGFAEVAVAGEAVGMASAIKMIRSVMVKGIEALSVECALAADAAGVLDAVVASLDASWPGADWRDRFDYNLDRAMLHGERRAAEMEEVAATLDALGTGAAMSRATVHRQRGVGTLHIAPPPGLNAKLRALAPFTHIPVEEAAA
ncbi:DUF1932 domain-containing protein [Sphingomonas hankookensis]|uniref:NAD(P)-dependent oxidoreductase n=1 Tax=Sphingomonas hengshuiensis TaxID=1609977 RepID=A0A2W5BB48_9SPHN|nr:MAG: NAD(P)-dependent oxidoreductase [Sphingomonas hengshuiensis]